MQYMKKHKRFAIKFTAALMTVAIVTSNLPLTALAEILPQDAGQDYTQFVDPFVATQVDNGQQFPGAVVPYGIVKLSPDTYPHVADDHAGYDYAQTQIAGFSHTRIEGVGGQGAGGDVLVTPTYVQYTGKPIMESRAQTFSHADETATPGYYAVSLTPKTGTDTGVPDATFGKIKAELTTTTRTGFHKYTFPKAGDVSLVTDLNYTYHGTDIRDAVMQVSKTASGGTAVSGRFSAHNVSGHGKYTMYFYMETDTPTTSADTWNGSDFGTDQSQSGNDIGAVLHFNVQKDQAVQIKVAVSPISSDQAKIDMGNEDSGWDFNAVKEQAKTQWNDILKKVDITSSTTSDPDGTLKKEFYTDLYRMFTTPVNATSTSGTYRGTDGKLYEAKGYTHYDSWTLWDDFHKYPMIGLICPDIYKDIIHSVADMLVTGISTWGNDTQPVPTVRNEHAVALLADGVAKGYTDIDDLEPAYEAAKKIANAAVTSDVTKQGYFTGRVDQTVEYSYDDWALSILAKQLGKTDEEQSYLNRSFQYKNLYKSDAVTKADNSKMGLLWPKDSSGNWMSANPEAYGDNGLYQGTLWQYTWWDSNDVGGLRNLMGGKDNMLNELETLFGAKGPSADGKLMLHSNTNEIDLQTPYLFNSAGKPSETQYWVRQIYTGKTWNRYSGTGEYNPPQYAQVYKPSPDGLMQTMDDDAGTMSTMFVSAAMGLYAMTPGDTTFQIGSPFFEKMTLDLGNGKNFTINANAVSPSNYYIQSGTLNGKNFNQSWLDYSQILRGGQLDLTMGDSPSTWAEDGITAPSSSDRINTSAGSSDPISYSTSVLSESDQNDGSIGNSIDIKVSGTTITGSAGASVLGDGKVSVSNVPAGLTANAVKLDDTTVRISLSGNAVASQMTDSTADLNIKLGEGLFANMVTSGNKDKNVRVEFHDYSIAYDKYKITSTEGNVDDTIHATLSGGAKFSGSLTDLAITNLPDGLTAVAENISDTEIAVHISGKMTNITSDYMTAEPVISFGDGIFDGGIKATDVENSTLSGMKALTLVNTMTPVAIAVSPPAKTTYVKGQPLDLTGGSVQVSYSVAELTKAVPLSSEDVTVGAPPAEVGENQPVDVTYEGKNTTFDVNIKALIVEDSGAILHYDFSDSTDGVVKDTIGNGYDGTLVNGAKVSGGSLTLTGSKSQYLNMPVGVLANLTGDATMSAWMNIASEQNNQTLLTAGINQQNFLIWVTNTVIRSGLDVNNQGEDRTQAATDTPVNKWVYLTYVLKDGVVTLYLNGQAVQSSAVRGRLSQMVQDGAIMRLGGSGIWSDPYTDGKISDFTIYNKALTPAEIIAEQAKANILQELVQSAQTLLDKGGYTADSLKALVTALDNANAILKLPNATTKQINDATDALTSAISALKVTDGTSTAFNRLEGEKSDAWSGGTLGNEANNLGGIKPGSWIEYKQLDFSNNTPDYIDVSYDNNSVCCPADTTMEVHLDSADGPLVTTVALGTTGNNWSSYQTKRFPIDGAKLAGIHDVYFVMRGSADDHVGDSGATISWLMNLDFIQFVQDISSYGKVEFESYSNWSTGALKTESSTDAAGTGLTDVGGSYNGAWVEYDDKNFGDAGADSITVRYVNNSSRCAGDSRLDIYLDSMDGSPVQTVPLPATGGNWNAYSTAEVKFSTPITGKHNLYFVMRGTTGTNPYIANLDWYQFTEVTNTAYGTWQLENRDDWSGGALKTENSTDSGGNSLVDVGGTYDGAWLKFSSRSFSGNGADRMSIRYVNNSGRCAGDSTLDVYLDSRDGTPVDTVSLPATGNNWNAYTQKDVTLTNKITGTHDVYLVMHGTTATNPYIANLDWVSFTKAADKNALQKIYDNNVGLLAKGDLYLPADFEKFKNAMDQAKEILDKSGATSDEILSAQNVLNAAVVSLHVLPDKSELQQKAEDAGKIDTSHDTAASVATLNSVLAYATGILNDQNATQADVTLATQVLQMAVDGLTEPASADKNIILAMITQANSILSQGYTADSFQALADAITSAKAVADDKYAAQDSVEEQVNILKAAIAGLKEQADNALVLKDAATGVQVIDSESAIPSAKPELRVTPLASGSVDYQKAQQALSFDSQSLSLFNISLTANGAAVNLTKGTIVKIRIPIPTGWDKALLTAYYIETNGSRTLAHGYVDGDDYVFNAERLGTFVIAQKKVQY